MTDIVLGLSNFKIDTMNVSKFCCSDKDSLNYFYRYHVSFIYKTFEAFDTNTM